MSFANDNPHFARIERAPYELGRLLKKLPVDFSVHEPLTPDSRLIAEAVHTHANNANDTLMHGLEALGEVVSTAGGNENREVSQISLMWLGQLITHLSVEAQFLQELDWSIRAALDADDRRAAEKKSSAASKKGGTQ